MTAEDLGNTCQNYMCIRLEHAQDAAARLQKTFSFEKCDLVENRELHLLGNAGDTKAVNKYLYQNGFEVEEIYMHRQDLEEYFLGRIRSGISVIIFPGNRSSSDLDTQTTGKRKTGRNKEVYHWCGSSNHCISYHGNCMVFHWRISSTRSKF